ncbi:MAG: two-component regulator propeller domain-containing protein [Cyclobacteriaceae bacterium]
MYKFNLVNNRLIKFISRTLGLLCILQCSGIGMVFCSDKFASLSVDDGLNHNSVLAILQDELGMMWFGTYDGLSRYDGYQFQNFRNNINSPSGMSHNIVNTLAKGDGGIWIGTLSGLNFYDLRTNTFQRYFTSNSGLPSDHIRSLLVDIVGRLWIGTDKGLCRMNNAQENHIEKISLGQDNLPFVTSMLESASGELWVGTNTSVFVYRDGEFTRPGEFVGKHLVVSALTEDDRGNIWIATLNDGLYILDMDRKEPLVHYDKTNDWFEHNDVRSVKSLKNGQVWVGTNNGGLLVFENKHQIIQSYNHAPKDANTINSSTIMAISEDNDGGVWLGNYEAGINYYHQDKKDFGWKKPATFSDYNITSLAQGSNGNIWVGTRTEGINRYNTKTGTASYFDINSFSERFSLQKRPVLSILEDKSRNLWIGRYEGGLLRVGLDSKQVVKYKLGADNSNAPQGNEHIYKILEDEFGKVWVGSLNGLFLFDKAQGKFDRMYNGSIMEMLKMGTDIWASTGNQLMLFDTKDRSSTYFDTNQHHDEKFATILSIHKDGQDNLWLGTRGQGLVKFHIPTRQMTGFTTNDGLANNIIEGILEDEEGFLWLSSNRGLTRFDPRSSQAINYEKTDGLQGNDFRQKSCLKTSSGLLVFGGFNGFNIFDPKTIQDNQLIPKPIITDLIVGNTSVFDRLSKVNLADHINFVNSIELQYFQSSIRFEFTSTNFLSPEKNRFSYQLAGHQDEWSNPTGQHSATFTNLPTGSYKFSLKTANNDGYWSDTSKTLKVVVLPPPWLSWWAYCLYAAVFLVVCTIMVKGFIRQQQLKNKLAVDKALTELKFQLFTNISHEFKTPLTLIMVPLQQLLSMEALGEKVKQKLGSIQDSANRLQEMINQLLDFRRLENKMDKPQWSKADIVAFVQQKCRHFNALAEEKQITFVVECEPNTFTAQFDSDKLEKIIYNLLSNSFKYTDSGTVRLKFKVLDDDKIQMSVSDTGVGMAKDQLPYIFDRFYQTGSPTKISTSTGIGLAYVNELVKCLDGTIEVESEPGKGTSFVVRIPLLKTVVQLVPENVNAEGALSDKGKTTILIVEDEEQLRAMLKEEFGSNYEVLEAENGEVGLELATELVPDLIVSDVSMPVMDGIRFTEEVRNKEQCNHIPIILLTAHTSGQHKIEGLQKGANDYINKPFNIFELKAKVENLLFAQKLLRQKIKKEFLTNPAPESFPDEQDKFLRRAMEVVETQLANSDFNVDIFCREIGMSRTQLYRKIEATTGQSVKEFIRTIRLKKAADLLSNTNMQVKEVALAVGFNNLPYFRKCFQEQFGTSPKKFGMKTA